MPPNHDATKKHQTPLGSRIELAYAIEKQVNFLRPEATVAAEQRLIKPQKHQTLNPQRLWADLLSAMPMCFNLFGPMAVDNALANGVLPASFPELPGSVRDVHLEWSPARLDPLYLGNRTAFDAAVELDLGDELRQPQVER